MASKAVLKLSAIHSFFGDYAKKALTRGENALESGHLVSFLYDGEYSHINASVLASMRNTEYKLSIDFNRCKILRASCSCARGMVSCHHIAAVMLHANRNISATDASCNWSAKNKKRQRNTGEPIDSVLPPKKKEFKALKHIEKDVFEKKLLEGVQACAGAGTAVFWLLSSEPERIDPPWEKLSINHPVDYLLSDDYISAPCKLTFLNSHLGVSADVIAQVASTTIGQSENPFWVTLRALRLTASNFGEILQTYTKTKGAGIPSKSLMQKLYDPPNLERVKATQWGKDHEDTALQLLADRHKLKVSKTGIWLHKCGYWGASPDGLINDDCTVEVKCIYSIREEALPSGLSKLKSYFVTFENGKYVPNSKHIYYDQIQAQLHFTNRSLCYFVMWTLRSIVVLNIPIDLNWASNIPVLQKFYSEHFIP